MQEKATLLLQTTWMKRTERMVEERRKGEKRQERAEVKAWHRSLQLLFSLWKWYHKAVFLSMLPCWSPLSVEAWVQIFLVKFKVPVGVPKASWAAAATPKSGTTSPSCPSVPLTTNRALVHPRMLQMDRGLEVLWKRVSSVGWQKGTGFSSPCATVPVLGLHCPSGHKPREDRAIGSSAATMSPSCTPRQKPPTAQDSITLFCIGMCLALMIPLQTILRQFHVG